MGKERVLVVEIPLKGQCSIRVMGLTRFASDSLEAETHNHDSGGRARTCNFRVFASSPPFGGDVYFCSSRRFLRIGYSYPNRGFLLKTRLDLRDSQLVSYALLSLLSLSLRLGAKEEANGPAALRGESVKLTLSISLKADNVH